MFLLCFTLSLVLGFEKIKNEWSDHIGNFGGTLMLLTMSVGITVCD